MKNFLNNLSIKYEIGGVALLLLLLMITASINSLWSLKDIGKEMHSIANIDLPLMANISQITIHQLEQAVHYERASKYALLKKDSSFAQNHYVKEVAAFAKLNKSIKKEINDGELLIENAIKVSTSISVIKEFKHIQSILIETHDIHQKYEEHVLTYFGQIDLNETEVQQSLAILIESEEENLDHILSELQVEVIRFTENAMRSAEEYEEHAEITTLILMVVSIILGLFVSQIISRRLTSRLNFSVMSLNSIAQGDLTQKIVVSGKDEIGCLQANTLDMQNKLILMIEKISQTSVLLSDSSTELTSSLDKTKINCNVQQHESEQVATAMHEMTTTIQEISSKVMQTAKAAEHAKTESDNGIQIVGSAIKQINQLSHQIDKTSGVINTLSEDTKNINSVLEVIISISDQTNLLALNAAIEAARAGELGRGFAVVADEVRTLAARTQNSTSEISQIIENLYTASNNAVTTIEQSKQQAEEVVKQASQADISFNAIAKSVSEINQMSSQIALSSEEQITVSEDISKSIINVSNMSSENTESTNSAYELSKELGRMAAELKKLTSNFQLNGK